MQKIKTPCVIFAGGKSSRMGKDKALLPFGGEPTLTQYQLKRLKHMFEKVYISTRTPEKFDFEADFINDREAEVFSPLVALVSVFEQIDAAQFFALSVDSPFVKQKQIDALLEHSDLYAISVAKTRTGIHPLCAVYGRSLYPLLKQALEKDEHRLQAILNASRIQTVDLDEESLLNVNYPSDYEEALKKIV